MKVRLGMSPISWTNDDLPELGGDTSLETCLRETREAGFTGTELGGKFPRDKEALKKILDQFDLSLVSGWYSGTLLNNSINDEKRRIQGQLSLFKEVGAEVIVYGETFKTVQNKKSKTLNSRPRLEDFDYKEYGKRLSELADYCADSGVELTLHHHMGTAVQDEKEIDIIMHETRDSVGLLLDTGHLVFAGGDINRVINNYGSRINHVHTKDIRAPILSIIDKDKESFLDSVLKGVFTVPGDGLIDYEGVIRKLSAVRYEGWIVIEAEQDPIKANPLMYAKKGYAELEHALQNVGYEIY
tara:strand:+ start:200 stop:1096 length:897 start_codon:yes stop_codon:yes gene_type:complete